MKRTWTIIGVADVASSFAWYQSLFGQPSTHPAHDDFGQIRTRVLVSKLEEEPHINLSTGTREFALRDLDGYYVMMSANTAA